MISLFKTCWFLQMPGNFADVISGVMNALTSQGMLGSTQPSTSSGNLASDK